MNDALYRCPLDSPIGVLSLVASDAGLRAVLWPDDRPGRVRIEGCRDADHDVLAAAAGELSEYFAGVRSRFDVPLDPLGTPFQQDVWAALAQVEPGTTTTYGAISRAVGRPGASRAVGAAVGRNPLSIIVPCHRVVGADGSLTGFAGGLAAKRWLLEHERRERRRSG